MGDVPQGLLKNETEMVQELFSKDWLWLIKGIDFSRLFVFCVQNHLRDGVCRQSQGNIPTS